MKLYFVKHGQTLSGSKNRLALPDEELVPAGVDEARQAAEVLKGELGDVALVKIISSPRKRTLQAARTIAAAFGIDPVHVLLDERLVERDCSPYGGQLVSDVFSQSEAELVAGGMEPIESLYRRSKDLYDELAAKDAPGAILLVSHSGNLAPLFYAAQGADFGDAVDIPALAADGVLPLNSGQ